MFVYGPAKRTKEGLLFTQEPSSVGMSCTPQIYRSNGNVSVISPDTLSMKGAKVHKYENVTEERLADTTAWDFSSMLNISNTQPSSSSGTVVLGHPIINTSQFAGDLLSFMLYRYGLLEMKTPLQPEVLEGHISKVFSLVFAVFIHDSGVLNDNISSNTTITPIRWSQEIIVRPRFLYSVIGITSLIVLVALIFGVPTQKYMFPANVNTLECALYLLYPSNIPKLLEQIHKPEKLSLNGFHKRVEGFRRKYRLGTLKRGAEFRLFVDSEERFDAGEGAETEEDLQRDDIDQGEDVSGSQGFGGNQTNFSLLMLTKIGCFRRKKSQGEQDPAGYDPGSQSRLLGKLMP